MHLYVSTYTREEDTFCLVKCLFIVKAPVKAFVMPSQLLNKLENYFYTVYKFPYLSTFRGTRRIKGIYGSNTFIKK